MNGRIPICFAIKNKGRKRLFHFAIIRIEITLKSTLHKYAKLAHQSSPWRYPERY